MTLLKLFLIFLLQNLFLMKEIQGTIGYSSPSNIALVKYWGKHGFQVPMNPSLSMTLENCRSNTRVHYHTGVEQGGLEQVLFNGQESSDLQSKLGSWLEHISVFLPWLPTTRLRVETVNNFPHAAGIASSASGMSALAMCIAGIARHLGQLPESHPWAFTGHMARLGSGSACRSLQGPYMLWGQTHALENASDEYAVVVDQVHPLFQHLHDTIIVVDQQPKAVSSRAGHGLMDMHPYRSARISQAHYNLDRLLQAMYSGDWPVFESVVENEALSLHALMMSSEQGPLLWKGSTVEWMHYLRAIRRELQIPMAFTLDAGANLHLLYPDEARHQVLDLLQNAPLAALDFIHDHTGMGARCESDDRP